MSQDWPFSVTSKVLLASGAEHLVTIRAATAADMRKRLEEASLIFPFATLVTSDDLDEETAQAEEPAQAVQPLKSNGNGNGNRPRSPLAAAERDLTHAAQVRAVRAQATRKDAARANGDVCPEHGCGIPSKKVPGGLYCPRINDDGTYCRWHS